MTAKAVVDAVRARLGDSVRERWDDATLLLYVSLCQNDICTFTKFYRKNTIIDLVDGTLIYDLPDDCITVNRLEYNCKLLPVETRNNIDKEDAVFPCVLFDNLAFRQIEFILGANDKTLYSSLMGSFGVVVDSSSPSCDLDDTYGVVVDVDPSVTPACVVTPMEMLVYYSAVPPLLEMDITDPDNPVIPTDNLILPDIWFQAFLHYVSGMALQDDNDANNIQRGEMEGQKYLRIMSNIMKTASKDFTSSIWTKLTTSYRRI